MVACTTIIMPGWRIRIPARSIAREYFEQDLRGKCDRVPFRILDTLDTYELLPIDVNV